MSQNSREPILSKVFVKKKYFLTGKTVYTITLGCKLLVCDYGRADPLPPHQYQIN